VRPVIVILLAFRPFSLLDLWPCDVPVSIILAVRTLERDKGRSKSAPRESLPQRPMYSAYQCMIGRVLISCPLEPAAAGSLALEYRGTRAESRTAHHFVSGLMAHAAWEESPPSMLLLSASIGQVYVRCVASSCASTALD